MSETPYERMMRKRDERPAPEECIIDLQAVPVVCPACMMGTVPESQYLIIDEDLRKVAVLMEHTEEETGFHCPRCRVQVSNRALVEPLFNGLWGKRDMN